MLTVWLTESAQRSTYLRTVVRPNVLMQSDLSNTDLGEGL